MTAKEPVYLGDSVYASGDGYHLVLTANDRTETIYLEPGVFGALVKFAVRSGFDPAWVKGLVDEAAER